MTDSTLPVTATIPGSARCPHWRNRKFLEGHEPIPVLARARTGKRTRDVMRETGKYICRACHAPLTFNTTYSVYVTETLIEEDPV